MSDTWTVKYNLKNGRYFTQNGYVGEREKLADQIAEQIAATSLFYTIHSPRQSVMIVAAELESVELIPQAD